MIAAHLLAAALLTTSTAAPTRLDPPRYLNCAGLREYPRGTRFRIEAGQRFDSPTLPTEHRFVVFGGAVDLIYFVLLEGPNGRLRGRATTLDTMTWEHETSPVQCGFVSSPAF
jgi:hypothetical protein